MRGVIQDLRVSLANQSDYDARSNLMWESTMGENRIIKLGKKCDFQCHQMEYQLGAYTNYNHGAGLIGPAFVQLGFEAKNSTVIFSGIAFILSISRCI